MTLTKRIRLLFLGVIFYLLASGQSFFAVTIDATHSDVQVEILEGNPDAVPPKFGIDPEDPNEKGTENIGLLKIDRVPNFTFGQVVTSNLYQMEYARNTNPYIQVSDFRGTLGGWTLFVKASDFVSERASTNKKKTILNGASLTLNRGIIESYDSEHADPPESYRVSINKAYQKIFQADENAGQGIWASRWQATRAVNDSIELTVLPGTAEKGREYQAVIYWKLADVPQTD